MTNDEIFKYKTKEIFDEAVEKIKESDKISFYRTQAFNDSGEADKAYEILMAHYNGLTEEEKKVFEASLVDLDSTDKNESASANAIPPPEKTHRTSKRLSARLTNTNNNTSATQTSTTSKVVALFTPEGAQYFTNENLAHHAFEKYRKEKGSESLNVGFFHFTLIDQAFEGYENFKNKTAVTKLTVKAAPVDRKSVV